MFTMLRTDSARTDTSVTNNINAININVVTEIQKELGNYDITSLVFLLYNVPDTALQELTLLQRVSKNTTDLNLLKKWALDSQSRLTWKFEFLEALTTCQLFGIIRKIGFEVGHVKDYFSCHNTYLDPIRKLLYQICENMEYDNFLKLKKTLLTYNINVNEYEACELVFLKLMSVKFITVNIKILDGIPVTEYNIKEFCLIIEKLPNLEKYARQLREYGNTKEDLNLTPASHSTPKVNETKNKQENVEDEKFDNFEANHELLAQLLEKKISLTNLKTDSNTLKLEDAYEIKNEKRVGVCYIINQEKFYPSKSSVMDPNNVKLSDRTGSTRDKNVLVSTWRSLNFHVIYDDNLEKNEIFDNINRVINKELVEEDSMFILCILSHGIESHIFSADSIPVSTKDIENLLDVEKLFNKPKVLFIQACQSNDDIERPMIKLVADRPKHDYYLKKSDFYILWATAPEYEAYRDEKSGSVFIYLLCTLIRQHAKHLHVTELSSKITKEVSNFCAGFNLAQLPISKSTLRGNLYFSKCKK